MKKVSAMFIGWAFCLLAVSAHGADFVQTIDKAKDLYLTDHAQEAAIKAKEGVHQLWKEIPFNVRHVRLVDNLTDYHKINPIIFIHLERRFTSHRRSLGTI